MGKPRRPEISWPTPEVSRRMDVRLRRWRIRCGSGVPLTADEQQEMNHDFMHKDEPPKGYRWPARWLERYYRLRLTGTDDKVL